MLKNILFVFWFASLAVASPCENFRYDAKSLSNLLTRTYQPYLKKTDRDVAFFHYGWRTLHYPNGVPAGKHDDNVAVPSANDLNDLAGPVDGDQEVTENGQRMKLSELYFRKKATGHFAAAPHYRQRLGFGLFGAVDPLMSLGYSGSGTKGLLMRIEVPKGVTYLDLQANHFFNEKDAETFWCNLRTQCEDKDCLEYVDKHYDPNEKGNFFLFNDDLLLETRATRDLTRQVFKELGVGFFIGFYQTPLFKECNLTKPTVFTAQAVFSDPELVSRLKLNILVPNLEKKPPVEKAKLYESVMNFFEAYDLTAAPKDFPRDVFFRYYKGWGTSLRQLNPEVDIADYQKQQNVKWQPIQKRHEKLTSQLFGCSPVHPSEWAN